ncbi:MAG: phosphoglycolate phosphatase [Roseibium sp.]|nr:phosphoglycolate phosphatase [Roseibium sp.]
MSVAIFDLDGTLVSSMEDLVDTLNAVLTGQGHNPVDYGPMRQWVGSGAKVLMQKGFEANRQPWTHAEIDMLFPAFIDHYEQHMANRTRPFEGAINVLDRLREKGWRLAVCTNKSTRLTGPLLDRLDLTRYFDSVVAGDTFARVKPHPEPVLGAIERAAGTVAGSVMIGDTRADIEAARAAGIAAIAVDFGYSPVPVHTLEPDAVVSHFNELESAFAALQLAPAAA